MHLDDTSKAAILEKLSEATKALDRGDPVGLIFAAQSIAYHTASGWAMASFIEGVKDGAAAMRPDIARKEDCDVSQR